MATIEYTLTVKNARNIDNKPADLVITTKSTDSGYQIKSLSYEKRLYSPCCINVELIRIDKEINLAGIKSDFGDKSVTLKITRYFTTTKMTDDTTAEITKKFITAEIATDYFVYQYNPVFSGSTCSVFLTLYSRDKLLTLDKFNKVYLNKKLGDGIIREMLCKVNEKNGPLMGCNVKFNDLHDVQIGNNTVTVFNEQRLQMLSYKIDTGQKDKGGNPIYSYHEAIQPYRVQYNEDFYSFISRIACRCGEFLYFEDGELKLGLDTGDTAVDLSGGIVLREEYPGFGNSSLKVTDYFRDYTDKSNKLESDASLPCSDYGAFDEYFDVLDSNVLPDKYTDELYGPDIAIFVRDDVIPAFGRLGWGKEIYTFSEKLTHIAVDAAKIFSSYKFKADDVNNKFKNFFNSSEKQHVDSTKLSQFADVRKDGYGRLLNKQLAEIRNKEMKAARETVRIQVESEFVAEKGIKLGSKVKLDSKEYRVVSCTGQYSETKEQTGTHPITGQPLYKSVITDISEFELVPAQSITITGEKSAVDRFIPPYNKCAESVPASPQIAIVTADDDPRYIGRVRVRYPWQGKEDAGSPWVRVLTPLASSSGALHFQPKKDDEVLLGYIDGNIDRPYVAGSLFNDKGTIHDSLYPAYNDTIRVGSQRLDFRKGTIQNWPDSVIPFAGLINSFMPIQMADMTKKYDDTSGWANELHGITRLTDKWSIWTIEGNTGNRSVTIDSAWGKVKIGAYTGIEIQSAGDISIKGANISISAQNNIKIESGIAIKNARKSEKKYKENDQDRGKTLFEGFWRTLVDIGCAKLDLSLIRTIWESFAPPKEGTLKIKSNRYLALEAGRGEAFDNDNIGGNDVIKRFSDNNGWRGVINDINAIHEAVAARHMQSNALQKLNAAKDSFSPVLTAFKKMQIDGVSQLNTIDQILENATAIQYNIERHTDYTTIISGFLTNPQTAVATRVWAQNWQSNMQEILDKKKAYDATIPALRDQLEQYNEKINRQYQNLHPTVETAFQNVIKDYLGASNAFKISNSQNWETYVNDLDIISEEPGNRRKWLKKKAGDAGIYLLEKWGLASDAEYERIYNDSKAKNIAEGRILMSQDFGTSMHITGNTIKETPNDNLESIRNALRRPFHV